MIFIFIYIDIKGKHLQSHPKEQSKTYSISLFRDLILKLPNYSYFLSDDDYRLATYIFIYNHQKKNGKLKTHSPKYIIITIHKHGVVGTNKDTSIFKWSDSKSVKETKCRICLYLYTFINTYHMYQPYIYIPYVCTIYIEIETETFLL